MQGLRALIDSINADEERRSLENFRFMAEHKIKTSVGPTLWDELKRHLKEHCEATKGKFEFDSPSLDEALVATKRDRLSLTYNKHVPCVFFEMAGGKGQLDFRVNNEGSPVQFTHNNIPHLPEEMASLLLMKMRK
jgi:hypothetical protein